MSIDTQPGAGQPAAINKTCVIEAVAKHIIAGRNQRGQRPDIRCVTTRKEDRSFLALKIGNGCFEPTVYFTATANERTGLSSDAEFLECRSRRIDDSRVVREAQVVIRSKIVQPLTIEFAPAIRQTANRSQFAQEPCPSLFVESIIQPLKRHDTVTLSF